MCIIVPIDHTPCAHTVAIWQHCANAPRSVLGHKPCSHIRQHGRPIVARKLCHNCGGPRFFARRGGIAARGSGSSILGDVKEQKEEQSEQYDSGYQSDIIPEADDDVEFDDPSLSPRQAVAPMQRRKEHSRQRSSNIPRSSGQDSNWRPNLKRDLSEISSISSLPPSRHPSIDTATSRFDDESARSFRDRLSSSDLTRLEQSLAPILRSPSAARKGSTLLHPSPPTESFESLQRACATFIQDLTPPATPPQRPGPPKRQSSTLLHPSSPELVDDAGFPFTFLLPAPVTTPPTLTPPPTSEPILCRPAAPSRKNSTLLHPSPPNDEVADPFLVSVKSAPTVISLPPTPLATPTLGWFKRCPSITHSAMSDDEWEGPLHSSHSDAEYDSDDQSAEADTESAHGRSSIKVARAGRTGRASQISLHGNQLRVLQSWLALG